MNRRQLRAMFPSEGDHAVAVVMVDTMKKAGLSERDIDRWLVIGRDSNDRIGAGQFASREDALDWTARQAEAAGIDSRQILQVAELPMYEAHADGSPTSVPWEPSEAEDKATIAQAEAAMRDGS